MMISMQGNWQISVKSKNAAFPQRFIIQGAATGNGIYPGVPATFANVTGTQWSVIIQNDPGKGWQTSATKIIFPKVLGGNYVFDIQSDDGGGSDADFNDLILSCSTPVNVNDFIIFGNVTLYGGRCTFNPCRKYPFVIDTVDGLNQAIKNPLIRDYLEKYYPERIPIKVNPNPPDPAPFFKPLVFDLSAEATKPKTVLKYTAAPVVTNVRDNTKASFATNNKLAASNLALVSSSRTNLAEQAISVSDANIKLVKNISGLFNNCFTEAGTKLTLTFEEYDRSSAEIAGGPYTGTGSRRLLGDTITDEFGNYIFRFSFDMSFPGLEDSSDIVNGENVDVVMYPDVIVKIVQYLPFEVRYESAPYYNIPNLKRINLCLPESTIKVTSTCFNGNLIGSLGNVFIGGNQNYTGSTLPVNLVRHGNSNYLESSGKISVNSPLAGFNVECAAWGGTIDLKGCMYNTVKTPAENPIKWYTVQIWREFTSGPGYVSQNYRHPKFSKRNLPNYIGDTVGPFYPNVGGALNGSVPAYTNIQREVFVDGIDWEFSNLDRYMQLSTALYDVVLGERKPGKFFVRVDGYSEKGFLVPGATDLIALFIHNNGLKVEMTLPKLDDPAIVDAGCGLFRLTNAQLKTPVVFQFMANDPEGFVDNYHLSMGRCPGTAITLNANIEGDFTISGGHSFPGGTKPSNVHSSCPGYKGTIDDYSNADLIDVEIQPTALGDGWIKPGEYFTIYSFSLTANQRVTNGYNGGISGTYYRSSQILMELLTP